MESMPQKKQKLHHNSVIIDITKELNYESCSTESATPTNELNDDLVDIEYNLISTEPSAVNLLADAANAADAPTNVEIFDLVCHLYGFVGPRAMSLFSVRNIKILIDICRENIENLFDQKKIISLNLEMLRREAVFIIKNIDEYYKDILSIIRPILDKLDPSMQQAKSAITRLINIHRLIINNKLKTLYRSLFDDLISINGVNIAMKKSSNIDYFWIKNRFDKMDITTDLTAFFMQAKKLIHSFMNV